MLRHVEKVDQAGNKILCTEDENGLEQGPFEIHFKGKAGGMGRGIYKDGKRNGPYEQFDATGQLRSRSTYRDGVSDGPSEQYYKNGQLEQKCTYKNGNLDGLYEQYYMDGSLWIKCYYKDGYKDGPCEQYFNDGEVSGKYFYHHNEKLEGRSAEYYLQKWQQQQKKLEEIRVAAEKSRKKERKRWESVGYLKGQLDMLNNPMLRKPIGPARTSERQAKAEEIITVRRAQMILSRAAQKAVTEGDKELYSEIEEVARPYALHKRRLQREFRQKRAEHRSQKNRE